MLLVQCFCRLVGPFSEWLDGLEWSPRLCDAGTGMRHWEASGLDGCESPAQTWRPLRQISATHPAAPVLAAGWPACAPARRRSSIIAAQYVPAPRQSCTAAWRTQRARCSPTLCAAVAHSCCSSVGRCRSTALRRVGRVLEPNSVLSTICTYRAHHMALRTFCCALCILHALARS